MRVARVTEPPLALTEEEGYLQEDVMDRAAVGSLREAPGAATDTVCPRESSGGSGNSSPKNRVLP